MTTRVYTRAEKTRRAALLIKGTKRAAGDVTAIEAQIEKLDQAAEDRGKREAAAHARRLEEAKDALAAARVAERCAGRESKATAKQARRDAEKQLRLVERATH